MKILLVILIFLFSLVAALIAVLSIILLAENEIQRKEKLLGIQSEEFIAFLQKRIKRTHVSAIKNALMLHLALALERRGDKVKALQTLRFVRPRAFSLDRSVYYTLLFSLLSHTGEREEAEKISAKYRRYIAVK